MCEHGGENGVEIVVGDVDGVLVEDLHAEVCKGGVNGGVAREL